MSNEPVIRVTVEDLLTGEKETVDVPSGTWFLTTTDPCYVAHTSKYPTSGTVVLTIKGETK